MFERAQSTATAGVPVVPTAEGRSERTLRILIVAESFLPQVNGVTNSVLRVIEHMTGRGHVVEVIAPSPGESDYIGVPVHRAPSLPVPGYSGLRVGRSKKFVWRVVEDFGPDVMHLAAPTILGRTALDVASERNVETVAVYQTDLAGFARRYGLRAVSPAVWRHVASIHDRASLTLAPSTSAVWDLRHRGVTNVKLWRRGVDTQRFSPKWIDPELRRRLAPNGEVVIGFVGRLAREKQVERLEFLNDWPGVKLVVVGDGPCRKKLERRLPTAFFTGHLSGAELSRYYASFDMFVHTGIDETFCQSVQEALSSGVPVVAPSVGGPVDLVAHGDNGYLWSPSSEASLAGAIGEMIANRMKRENLAARARSTVEHRTWATVMDELEGHYLSVVGGLTFAYRGIAA